METGLPWWLNGKESVCNLGGYLQKEEMGVGSLDWEDPLEKEMATHSSILAWKISQTKGDWWVNIHGVAKEMDMTERLSTWQARKLGQESGRLVGRLLLLCSLLLYACLSYSQNKRFNKMKQAKPCR